MGKRSKAPVTLAGSAKDDKKKAFVVLADGVVIDGKKVANGDTVKMTQESADLHRSHGVPLGDPE